MTLRQAVAYVRRVRRNKATEWSQHAKDPMLKVVASWRVGDVAGWLELIQEVDGIVVVAPPSQLSLRAQVDRLDLSLIEEAVTVTHGNMAAAARLLGESKTTIYDACRRLGIQYRTRKPARAAA